MKTFWFLKTGIAVSLLVLLMVVLRLNLVRGSYYKKLARENKLTETLVLAKRGKIFDTKGRLMAESLWQDGILKRKYIYGESAGVVTGYVGKVNEEEMKMGKCGKKMNNQTQVGRGGVEETMNCELLGTDGRKLTENDALGAESRQLGVDDPIEGKDVKLSIDAFYFFGNFFRCFVKKF